MNTLQKIRFILHISQSQDVVRRYFVVNGFDGALTLLGLNTGFYLSGHVDLSIAIHACMGAAVALGISGLSSAYLSESAERQRELAKLQQAMVTDLNNSVHSFAAKVVPIFIALVNGLAPFTAALLITVPLWLAHLGFPLPYSPIELAIAVAFTEIFCLGLFLARVSKRGALFGGLKAVLIALVTMLLVLQMGH